MNFTNVTHKILNVFQTVKNIMACLGLVNVTVSPFDLYSITLNVPHVKIHKVILLDLNIKEIQ